MIPHFTNTTAFWALLAIPLITAIHFLQHKTKTQATATLFLLEALVPEAHEGNAWDRLRASRSFWMQILAVLLLTWVLAAPVWPGKGSGQTVVFILDDSANMTPFRQEAVNAVSEDMDAILRSGIPATWVLMGSRASGQPLYRGRPPARPCTPWISGSRAKEHMTWPLPCAPPQPLPVQRASRA